MTQFPFLLHFLSYAYVRCADRLSLLACQRAFLLGALFTVTRRWGSPPVCRYGGPPLRLCASRIRVQTCRQKRTHQDEVTQRSERTHAEESLTFLEERIDGVVMEVKAGQCGT